MCAWSSTPEKTVSWPRYALCDTVSSLTTGKELVVGVKRYASIDVPYRREETRLVAKKGYEKASLGQRVWYTVEGILE
jgi:hypothetical protein